ncbi:hypothetical protein [Heyndrickxia oleronia]|uniref:Uncharacterized protein n=1 Tax=Heyndrickxia oleronia TaxID=38875 RepID=A0AAW6SSS8_9BACI|nr:hypothetical protein [Heyndrickxia oleronia]MDH5159867.1 hypothetical protein [Heyndrickxia oleronia]
MKKYHVTEHAIDRAVERLGQKREYAANHLITLMQTAYLVGENGTKKPGDTRPQRIYDHYNSKTRLIVGDGDVIITVYKFPESVLESKSIVPEAFAEDIRQLVQRKFKAKERDFKRKQRALEIELAELNLELAQLTLNKLKAKSPKARNSIADKIDEVTTKVERIKFEINQAESAFEAMMKEVDAICKDSN